MAAYIPENVFKRPTLAQMSLVWRWRNALTVRQNMFDDQPIVWAAHQQWYQAMLESGLPDYWLFWQNQRPIGVLNFKSAPMNSRSQNSNNRKLTVQWGCYLGEDNVWPGSGLLLEVAALDYALNHGDCDTLQAEVLAFNQNVINMHRWFGYELEEVVDDFVERDGKGIAKWVMNKSLSQWSKERAESLSKLPMTYQKAVEQLRFNHS